MSLDTRNKRASAVNVALPCSRVFPNPDGSVNIVADRAQIALSYALASVIAITFNAIWASNSNRSVGQTLGSD